MAWFLVSARGGKPAAVEAPNWLSALGAGLEELDAVAAIDRLACEVLPNGTVLIRDVRSGQGFVVQPSEASGDALDEDTGELLLMPADTEGTTGEAMLPQETTQLLLEDPLAGRPSALLDALLQRIEATSSADEAWQVAMSGARSLIPSESAAALARDWDDTLRFVHALGPRAGRLVGKRLAAGQGIAGFCVQRQVSLVLQEPHQDPRFYEAIDRMTGYRTANLLAAPVCFEGSVFGCLEVLNAPEAFTRSHLEILSTIADSLAEQLLVVG